MMPIKIEYSHILITAFDFDAVLTNYLMKLEHTSKPKEEKNICECSCSADEDEEIHYIPTPNRADD